VQAARLAHLSAARLAYVEGRPEPNASAIDMEGLVGSVLVDPDDPAGEIDESDTDIDASFPRESVVIDLA
jgi:hypothetical protein